MLSEDLFDFFPADTSFRTASQLFWRVALAIHCLWWRFRILLGWRLGFSELNLMLIDLLHNGLNCIQCQFDGWLYQSSQVCSNGTLEGVVIDSFCYGIAQDCSI